MLRCPASPTQSESSAAHSCWASVLSAGLRRGWGRHDKPGAAALHHRPVSRPAQAVFPSLGYVCEMWLAPLSVQQTWAWAWCSGRVTPHGERAPWWALLSFGLCSPVCHLSGLMLLLSHLAERLSPLQKGTQLPPRPPILYRSLRSSEPARTFPGSWIAQMRWASPLLVVGSVSSGNNVSRGWWSCSCAVWVPVCWSLAAAARSWSYLMGNISQVLLEWMFWA